MILALGHASGSTGCLQSNAMMLPKQLNARDGAGCRCAWFEANAPLTVKAAKYIVGEVMKDESQRNLVRCTEMVEQCFTSRDFIEGRTAFMEKRKPAFTGSRGKFVGIG